MRALLRSGVLWPCCLLACSATPLASPPEGETTYRLDSITAPDGVLAVGAIDINDQGQVTGSSLGPAGQDAFTWSAKDGFVQLGRFPTAYYMEAIAINESGVVAGNAWWEDGTARPVIWTQAGQAQDIGVSGAAQGMNDLGHVVGYASPPGYSGIGEAFLWDATNGVTMLGTLGGTSSLANGVNKSDDVVGTSETADGQSHAFLWSQGTMTDLTPAGETYSEGYAISDAGVVTGIHAGPSGETRAFRWTRSEGMVDVGPVYDGATDGPTSMSTDINTVGQITGGVEPPGQSIRAAVRQPGSGAWQELMTDWPFVSFALGVNNLGVIVGYVADSTDIDLPTRAVIWTPMRGTVVGAH